jgi:hypothetical protein
MTRRELAEGLAPAAGEEAELEAKFLLGASRDEIRLRQALNRRLASLIIKNNVSLPIARY